MKMCSTSYKLLRASGLCTSTINLDMYWLTAPIHNSHHFIIQSHIFYGTSLQSVKLYEVEDSLVLSACVLRCYSITNSIDIGNSSRYEPLQWWVSHGMKQSHFWLDNGFGWAIRKIKSYGVQALLVVKSVRKRSFQNRDRCRLETCPVVDWNCLSISDGLLGQGCATTSQY